MEMLTIGICDDNEMYLNKMRKLVDDYILERNFRPQHIVIYTFTSAKDILRDFEKFNLLFIDIEMPDINGIELKNRLEDLKFKGKIVFVTNHDSYMKKAFGNNVISYISKNELHAMKKILRSIESRCCKAEIIKLADTQLNIYDIYYIKSDYGYCNIYTREKNYIFSISLNDVMKRIHCNSFMRVHRSYIVNFQYIDTFYGSEIKLLDGRFIKLSRRLRPEFKNKFFTYLKDK